MADRVSIVLSKLERAVGPVEAERVRIQGNAAHAFSVKNRDALAFAYAQIIAANNNDILATGFDCYCTLQFHIEEEKQMRAKLEKLQSENNNLRSLLAE